MNLGFWDKPHFSHIQTKLLNPIKSGTEQLNIKSGTEQLNIKSGTEQLNPIKSGTEQLNIKSGTEQLNPIKSGLIQTVGNYEFNVIVKSELASIAAMQSTDEVE